MTESVRVLFVDDEVSVLRAIRRGLRLRCKDWNLTFTESPLQALELIRENPPHLVVSDKRMPEMDGVQFLKVLAEEEPQIVRVMLSGDTSGESAAEAAVVSHILLAKPFDLDELAEMLKRANCLRQLPLSHTQKQTLGSLQGLPVLPDTYQKLQAYLGKGEIDTAKVALIVSEDVAVLSKLLQLANSPFFGFSSPVKTAHETVIRLGVDMIRQLVLCIGLFHRDEENAEQHKRLFDYAQRVAGLMAEFSRNAGYEQTRVENAFMLGLLHNIGCLAPCCGPASSDCPLISAYLLKLWGFNDALVEQILYQDRPLETEDLNGFVADLYAAKMWISGEKEGQSTEEITASIPADVLRRSALLAYLENTE